MHPLVDKFIAGQLPEPMAQTLAGGGLPISPLDLLYALAHAIFRETPYTLKAQETLEGMPASQLSGAILGAVDPPDPLGVILIYRKEPDLLETALLHENMTAEWMERVVPHLPGAVLEIPLNNQVMWLERPAILTLLEAHPEADYQVRRRVNEFRRDVLHQISAEVAQERFEILDDVETGKLDKAWAELPPPEEDSEEDQASAEELRRELQKPVLDFDGQEVPRNVTQRIMRLSTNQKIMLAIKGGKEERTILIRESNRLIQVNVINNPRITESEIAYIAAMRVVNEEVLRLIANSRDWMRKYTIVKNLIQNPRTPIGISMNNLKRLNEFDMKLMQKDKNIPEILRREAKRFLENKSAGKG